MRVPAIAISILGAALLLLAAGCSEQNPRVATKINQEATLKGKLPLNPLQGKVITSWIDKKNSTMSTLFGNDLAIQAARQGTIDNYPSGSILSAITWRQQEDARWFGGKIPAEPVSVEIVTVGATQGKGASYSYQRYEGRPLKEVALADSSVSQARTKYLLQQRASVMP